MVTGHPSKAAFNARVQVAAVRSGAYCSNAMKFDTGSMATKFQELTHQARRSVLGGIMIKAFRGGTGATVVTAKVRSQAILA